MMETRVGSTRELQEDCGRTSNVYSNSHFYFSHFDMPDPREGNHGDVQFPFLPVQQWNATLLPKLLTLCKLTVQVYHMVAFQVS